MWDLLTETAILTEKSGIVVSLWPNGFSFRKVCTVHEPETRQLGVRRIITFKELELAGLAAVNHAVASIQNELNEAIARHKELCRAA
jgi:hypothetical protein